MAEEELELDVTQTKSNKLTIILLVALILLVLVVGGVAAWLYLGSDSEAGSDNADAGEAEPGKPAKPLLYQTMVPEFVVNFGPGSKARYLQVDLQVSTRDEEAIAAVNTYRPVLRNDILVLLSGQTFEKLSERSGKETLQKQLLNTINKIVVDAMKGQKKKKAAEEGDEMKAITAEQAEVKGPIENVYFLSFIMQ